jgi:hypothetical protein
MSRKGKHIPPEFVITGSDPRRVRAVQQLRRSSASGAHDSTPRRTRTRGAARRAAIRQGY